MYQVDLLEDPKRMNQKHVFEQEFLPLMEALYNYAVHLTRNKVEAEDLVQETYKKAFGSVDKYQQGTNAKAWLFRILYNTFINELRYGGRRPRLVELEEAMTKGNAVPASGASNLSETPFQSSLGDEITWAVNSLDRQQRAVVIMAYLEDFKYEEIAAILQVPVGTVRSRLHRAKKVLEKKLLSYAISRGYRLNN